jgi:hypothetical protein
MTTFRGTIYGDKYPAEFNVEASDWPTAAARMIKQWKQTNVGKGSRTSTLTIKMIRLDRNNYL